MYIKKDVTTYRSNPHYAFENLLCLQTLSPWSLRYFSLIHHSDAMLFSRKAPWPLRLNPHNDSLIHNAGLRIDLDVDIVISCLIGR